MGPETLAQVLRPLHDTWLASASPDLLVGLGTADDAAVFRLRDDLAIVATVDFFPPIVDDPLTFGAIAATNALGDVYAMGGQPLLALNVAAFPADLDPAILTEILRGGAEQVRRSGALVVGGHTVTDPEPKFGLAVFGTVDPAGIITKGGVVPGDVLILTKPIGTGIITTALKGELIAEDGPEMLAAVESMTTLLRDPLRVALARRTAGALAIHAGTDITGFGLLGHALEMLQSVMATALPQSGLVPAPPRPGEDPSMPGMRIALADVPLLPGARELAARGAVPGGTGRNLEHLDLHIRWGKGVTAIDRQILADPQTAGGLLLAVPLAEATGLLADLAAAGVSAWQIGTITETGMIEVVRDGEA